jgi:translation initiation factor RLI1
MQKWVDIITDRCLPDKCGQEHGLCQAVDACKHNMLEQEEPYEVPMLISRKMCVGCGDCVKACPLQAIMLSSGL